MNFMNKFKQTICLKILSLLGYIIFFYTIFWDIFYTISTEEELIAKELNALFFGFYFYLVCICILLFTPIEIMIRKSFQEKTLLNLMFKIGLYLHITPILNIFIIIIIPLFQLLLKR